MCAQCVRGECPKCAPGVPNSRCAGGVGRVCPECARERGVRRVWGRCSKGVSEHMFGDPPPFGTGLS